VNDRRGSFPFPDVPQAVAFYQMLMQRLGVENPDPPDEARLKSTLERAHGTVQHQRGDVVTLGSFLLFGLIRDKPFGKDSLQAGIALTLAFLWRNGAAVVAPEEEIAGISIGIAQGEVYAGMVEMWLRQSARPAW
jgi:prophage maintenance system killer protein